MPSKLEGFQNSGGSKGGCAGLDNASLRFLGAARARPHLSSPIPAKNSAPRTGGADARIIFHSVHLSRPRARPLEHQEPFGEQLLVDGLELIEPGLYAFAMPITCGASLLIGFGKDA